MSCGSTAAMASRESGSVTITRHPFAYAAARSRLSHLLRGLDANAAADDRARRDLRARPDDRVGAEPCALADPRAGADHALLDVRLGPDHDAVVQHRALDERTVADGAVLAEHAQRTDPRTDRDA